MSEEKRIYTTGFGAPIDNGQNSKTAGEPGPVLMQDTHPNDDYFQAGELYRRVMTDEDREHLVGNITTHLCNARKRIQLRQSAVFYKADEEYGSRVAEGLKLDVKEVKRLAGMSQEERAEATSRNGAS